MKLSPTDAKLLRDVLRLGRELESARSEASKIAALRAAIADLETSAQAFDLKRLAIHARACKEGLSAQQLTAILVPFERLSGRALRDDEILVTTLDRVGESRDVGPLTVIADQIRSAFNVGAILRTSEAFGVEEVLLTGYTSTPEEERTAKTSMGAQDHVPWRHLASAQEAIHRLKEAGYKIVALETTADASELGSFRWPAKSALIVGNERFGVDQDLLSIADHKVQIPLAGVKNSLNVGIALGIALADWRRGLDEVPRYQTVAVYRGSARHPYEARRQASVDHSGQTGTIEFEKNRGFEQALDDIEGFERIWIVYDFDRNHDWKPKTTPPRGPRVKRGVFATRSPYRPSPIGLSCVRLLNRDGLTLTISETDLLDGTPILDIKPYLPGADSFPGSKTGWLEGVEAQAFSVEFTDLATRQLAWLSENGVLQIEGFLRAQLEYSPLDAKRKRVTPVEENKNLHQIAYRTWRALFELSADSGTVVVRELRSGYDACELVDGTDVYADKSLHLRFNTAVF